MAKSWQDFVKNRNNYLPTVIKVVNLRNNERYHNELLLVIVL